jgi:hypothetical protein
VVILSSKKNFYPKLESEFIAFNLTEVLENYKLSENMQEIYELLSNFIKIFIEVTQKLLKRFYDAIPQSSKSFKKHSRLKSCIKLCFWQYFLLPYITSGGTSKNNHLIVIQPKSYASNQQISSVNNNLI